MRAVSAKALYILLLSTLLRLQRDHHLYEIAQGVATLYPGLCSSALTARAAQCIFCEQAVSVNQEQFHFGYNKLYTLIRFRIWRDYWTNIIKSSKHFTF